MGHFFRPAVLVSTLATVLLSVAPSTGTASAALITPEAEVAPAETFSIYLPTLILPGTAPVDPAPGDPAPVDPAPIDPPPAGERGALFMEAQQKTIGSSLAVDGQGGLHVAYSYRVPQNEQPDGIYAYCPPPASQCLNDTAWSRINLGGPVDDVQLRLTAAGQPRLLITSSPAEAGGDKQYWYAQCDATCGDSAQWGVVHVTSGYTGGISGITGVRYAKRSFALDDQGRPRFVFYDANYRIEPDRYGGYYYACDADCTVGENWTGSRFTHQRQRSEYSILYEKIDEPVLTFTSTGQPRVLAVLFPLDDPDGTDFQVYYFACDSDCSDDANWDRARVSPRGGGPYPAWDLELDANDRPRAMVYREAMSDGTGKQLLYYQCEADCLNEHAWSEESLGLGSGTGLGVDLALDEQGRPRSTYLLNSGDVGYSWCNNQCAEAASWQHAIAESNGQLTAAYPVARPTTCDAGLWDSYAPNLVLDSLGNPRIAYNAGYAARCSVTPDPANPDLPPSFTFREIWHTVRLIYTVQP